MPEICPYCKKEAKLVTGKVLYPHNRELHWEQFWRCEPCGAYVGCHKGTDQPLGNLADQNLRSLRRKAHASFDVLWKKGFMKRKTAYNWLADTLELDGESCHIGLFDAPMCRKVVLICRPYAKLSLRCLLGDLQDLQKL